MSEDRCVEEAPEQVGNSSRVVKTCFKFVRLQKNFQAAEKYCREELNMSLARINNTKLEEKKERLLEEMNSGGHLGFRKEVKWTSFQK